MLERVVAQLVFVEHGCRDHIAIGVGGYGHIRDPGGAELAGDRDRIGLAIAPDRSAANRQHAQPVGAVDREAAVLHQRVRIGRRAFRQVVFVDHFFGRLEVETVDGHDVVRAVDRDRQRRRRAVAVAIGDRVIEHLGQAVVGVEALDQRVRIIELVSVAAVRIERQRAVQTGKRSAHRAGIGAEREGRHFGAVRTLRISAIVAIGFGIGDDIAAGSERTVFGHAVRVGTGRGHIVDDVNVEIAGGRVAVLVGNGHFEAVEGVVAVGIGGQLVSVTDLAFGDRGHGQSTEAACESLADSGHCSAADRDHRRAIGRGIGEGAARELAVGRRSRTGRKTGLIDFGTGFTGNRKVQRNRAVADRNDQRGRGRIAVAVRNHIIEAVFDIAGRTRIAGVAVGAVGRDRQRTIGTLHRLARSSRTARAREGRDARIVRANGVVAKNVSANRTILARCNRIAVIRSRGNIVDDRDDQRGRSRIAVAIGNGEREALAVRIGKRVVEQLETVAVSTIVFGDRQNTSVGRNLTAAGHIDAVDDERSDGIAAGRDRDRSVRDFSVARSVGAGRLAVAGAQCGLVDIIIACDRNFRRGIG